MHPRLTDGCTRADCADSVAVVVGGGNKILPASGSAGSMGSMGMGSPTKPRTKFSSKWSKKKGK